MIIGYDGKFLWRGNKIGSRSGHGIHARHLLEEMLALAPGDRFRVYALDDNRDFDSHPGCDTVTLPAWAQSSTLRNLLAFPLALRRQPVDVLLSYSTLPISAPCKTALLLADIFWLANPGWLPKHMALPRTLATRMSVRRADRIITTTEFSKHEISRILEVPEDKIDVVPHGIRQAFQERLGPEDIDAVRRRHGLSEHYILSLNDLHPRKNVEGLVIAFERLKARVDLPHKLVIAGRSLWPYPALYQRIENSPVAGDIVMLGYVPSEDVLALYQGAELFVYPSFYEGWGLQVHEAMVAGVPVAIANNTTMPEIAGDAAEQFDPYDTDDMSQAMERVLTDAGWAQTLVARGLERVKLYSWRRAAEETLVVCRDLAGKE